MGSCTKTKWSSSYRHQMGLQEQTWRTGQVVKNKGRLVAQGYNHKEGIEFDETYVPVTRLESIRILLMHALWISNFTK